MEGAWSSQGSIRQDRYTSQRKKHMTLIAWSIMFTAGCILHVGGINAPSGKEAGLAGLLICIVSGAAFLFTLALPALKKHGSKSPSEIL